MNEIEAAFATLSKQQQESIQPFLWPPFYEESWYYLSTAGGVSPQREIGGRGLSVSQAVSGCPAGKVQPGWGMKQTSGAGVTVDVWWDQVNRPGDEALVDELVSPMLGIPYILNELIVNVGMKPPMKDGGSNLGLCRGTDDNIDVSLVPLPPNVDGLTKELTNASPGPAYIEINNALRGKDLRASVAHELMHAMQFSYKQDYGQSEWLSEATATWAEDDVYPTGQTEEQYYIGGLENQRLSRPPDDLQYSDLDPYRIYIFFFFFFFLAGKNRLQKDMVSRIWDLQQTQPVLQAINSVIPGGFKEQWPKFAVDYWNDPAISDFSNWDGLPIGMADPKRTGSRNVTLDGRAHNRTYLVGQVEPLTAKYFLFKLDDNVRGVALWPWQGNGGGADSPGLTVTALLKKDGKWVKTPLPWLVDGHPIARSGGICREATGEDSDEIALIFSNSNYGPSAPTYDLSAMNLQSHRGCTYPGYKGVATDTVRSIRDTATSHYEFNSTVTVNWSSRGFVPAPGIGGVISYDFGLTTPEHAVQLGGGTATWSCREVSINKANGSTCTRDAKFDLSPNHVFGHDGGMEWRWINANEISISAPYGYISPQTIPAKSSGNDPCDPMFTGWDWGVPLDTGAAVTVAKVDTLGIPYVNSAKSYTFPGNDSETTHSVEWSLTAVPPPPP